MPSSLPVSPAGAGQGTFVGFRNPLPANQDLQRYWAGAEAAWYPDPSHPDKIRYWNGFGWTGLVTPKPPPLDLLDESARSISKPYPAPAPVFESNRRCWHQRVRSALQRAHRALQHA